MSYRTEAPGKWILAGEHAVLRGCPALVFPLRSRQITLEFEETPDALTLSLQGDHGAEIEPLFWALLERACGMLNVSRAQLRGRIKLSSNLPLGAGLGASASFCVVMTRWLESRGLPIGDGPEFARRLEDLFHGESSGLDVAVAWSNEGLRYERGGERRELKTTWSPTWTLSFCGQRGLTSEAVRRVKDLLAQDPERGAEIDARMRRAVDLCEQALQSKNQSARTLLIDGMKTARSCFEDWGLADGAVADHMRSLREAGAIAVKPTGSGGGGYVLALWDGEPPPLPHLLRC